MPEERVDQTGRAVGGIPAEAEDDDADGGVGTRGVDRQREGEVLEAGVPGAQQKERARVGGEPDRELARRTAVEAVDGALRILTDAVQEHADARDAGGVARRADPNHAAGRTRLLLCSGRRSKDDQRERGRGGGATD